MKKVVADICEAVITLLSQILTAVLIPLIREVVIYVISIEFLSLKRRRPFWRNGARRIGCFHRLYLTRFSQCAKRLALRSWQL